DSLWSLPLSFEETIKGANEGLKKQLGDQLLNDEFLPMGDMFVRNVMGPSGDMETQVLPGYNFFQYIKPTKLPELKDSNNRTWDLTDYKALTEEGAPTTTELQSMVKLAREQMNQDFKKTYDPENTFNRETAAIAFDPAAQAKVFQSAQSALQRLFTDPKTALEFAAADDDGKAAMRESAMNSGYLVGPTEGGAFGDHHFQQFFAILKMKEKYNEIKNKGQALQSDPLYKGFEGVGGAGAAKFYVQNKSTINAIDSVLSTIPVVNRINPLAIMKSVVNGGIIGLVTNVASVVTEVVSTVVSTIATAGTATTIVSMDYSYEQGFGAKVDVGVGIGPARISYATIGYSEFGGFEASVGVTGKLGPVEVGARMTYSEKNGFGASASAGVGPFTAGLTYSQQGGLSAAVGYKNANGVVVGLGWSEKGGVSASVGMATKGGYEGGVSFNKDEGFGAYAAKNEFNKNNQITGSKAITFNERDGVGVKITDKDPSGANSGLGIDPHTSVSISQRGGVTVDYENANGFGGSVNVGWNGSYSGSVTQKYDAGTNARGVGTVNFDSEGNFSGSNKTSMISRGSLAGGQDDVDWQNGIALGQGSLMGAMESVSENVAANYAKLKEAHRQYAASEGVNLTPEQWDKLSDSAREEIVQRLKTGNAQHTSRDSFGERVLGSVSDFVDQLTGTYSDHAGWVDEGGEYTTRTCFVAGTLIKTKDGYKKIEEIQVGDYVLSYNESSESTEYNQVVKTFEREATRIYKIVYENGRIIETTETHPFYIDGKGWISAKYLVRGDRSVLVNEGSLSIVSISIDDRLETVYNFEVENAHTYFVTEDAMLVHNKCVINGSKAERKKMLALMQKLTDDNLGFDEDGKTIIIKNKSKNSDQIGTQLLRDLIGDEAKTTMIRFKQKGEVVKNCFTSCAKSEGKDEDVTNGVGVNQNVIIDLADAATPFGTVKYNKKTGEPIESSFAFRKIPLQFTIAHELIHANRFRTGTAKTNKSGAMVRTLDPLRASDYENANYEEAEVTGLPIYQLGLGIGEPINGLYQNFEYDLIENQYSGPSQNAIMKQAGYDYIRFGYYKWNE
ncbi:polymorphic toxin-type HINT domain-containing protein, partial [Leptospira yasudae]